VKKLGYLKRQAARIPTKTFTARLPEELYDALAEFSLDKRFVLTAAASYLLEKALAAETGRIYIPYTPDEDITAAESIS
jgi:hypothetical protein